MNTEYCEQHEQPKLYLLMENQQTFDLLFLHCENCLQDQGYNEEEYVMAATYFNVLKDKKREVILNSAKNQQMIELLEKEQIFDNDLKNQLNKIKTIIDLLDEYGKPDFSNFIYIQALLTKLRIINIEIIKSIQSGINEKKSAEDEVEIRPKQLLEAKFSLSFHTSKEPVYAMLQVQDIIFFGCRFRLKQWRYYNNQYFEEDEIKYHDSDVIGINYVQERLISNSDDGVILIWIQKNKKWINIKKLEKFQLCIENLICDHLLFMYNSEDWLITYDVTDFQNKQYISLGNSFKFACLNSTYTYLIIVLDNGSQIYQRKQQNQWDILQIIEQDQKITKIAFVDSNTFVTQKQEQNFIVFYEKIVGQEEFQNKYVVQSYPQIYSLFLTNKFEFVQDLQLLLDFNGSEVSYFSLNSKKQYELKSRIQISNDLQKIKTPLLLNWNQFLGGIFIIWEEE